MARLFIHEPTLHQSAFSLSWVAPANVWNAPSADEWYECINRSLDTHTSSQETNKHSANPVGAWGQITRQDPFNIGMKLEHLGTMAIEESRLGSLPQTAGFVEESLLSIWKEQLLVCGQDHFMLRPLWHSVFITTLSDIVQLELAVGKEGEPQPDPSDNSPESYARRWAASKDAQRAALHAYLLFRELEAVPIRVVTPIHISSSLYHAAMIWYCYLRFSPADGKYTEFSPEEFEEFACIGIHPGKTMHEANEFKQIRPTLQDSTVLSGIIDMLKRIGYFGLSRSLASLMILLTRNCIEDVSQF